MLEVEVCCTGADGAGASGDELDRRTLNPKQMGGEQLFFRTWGDKVIKIDHVQ